MKVAVVPVKRFKFVLLLFVTIVAAVLLLRGGSRAGPPLPDIHFYDKSGRAVTLAAFKGEVVLVNLWATWCAPCVAEMPLLDKVQGSYPKEKFRVVAISVDTTSMQAVQNFLKKRGVKNIDAYWDKDVQAAFKWSYGGIPTSFLLDTQSGVVKRYDGVVDVDGLDKDIGALLP